MELHVNHALLGMVVPCVHLALQMMDVANNALLAMGSPQKVLVKCVQQDGSVQLEPHIAFLVPLVQALGDVSLADKQLVCALVALQGISSHPQPTSAPIVTTA